VEVYLHTTIRLHGVVLNKAQDTFLWFGTYLSTGTTVPYPTPIQWVPGALYPRVKWPWREADNSPPSSAKVKNAWICISTPPYVFMAWCIFQYRIRLCGEANSHSACKEIPRLLWSPKVHYRVHKSSPLVPVLGQMHPAHIFPPYFLKFFLMLSSSISQLT
jgi:hypothetical protein